MRDRFLRNPKEFGTFAEIAGGNSSEPDFESAAEATRGRFRIHFGGAAEMTRALRLTLTDAFEGIQFGIGTSVVVRDHPLLPRLPGSLPNRVCRFSLRADLLCVIDPVEKLGS